MPGLVDTIGGLTSGSPSLAWLLGGLSPGGGLQEGNIFVPAFAGGTLAALDVNFVQNTAWAGTALASIPTLLSCTRASSGYYTTAGGVLVNFPNNNTLRYGSNGLLTESGSTNIFIQSQNFPNVAWTNATLNASATATFAPDGTLTGNSLTENATGANTYQSLQSVSITTTLPYSASIYVRAGARTQTSIDFGSSAFATAPGVVFNLIGAGSISQQSGAITNATITALANGWYWCTATTTSTSTASANIFYGPAVANSQTYTGTNGTLAQYVWGAQLEQANQPSSYIPTTTASLSRASELVLTTSATWLTSPGPGTILCTYLPNNTVIGAVASVNDGSLNNKIDLRNAAGTVQSVGANAGVTFETLVNGSWVAGSVGKVAIAFANSDQALSFNGIAPTTNATGTIPTFNRMQFGGLDGVAGFGTYGYLRRLTYWNTRQTNAILQQITTLP